MGARLRLVGFTLMMLLFMAFIVLLFFSSFHFHTFWALGFGFFIILFAVFIPNICKGYDFREVRDVLPSNTSLSPEDAQAQRECGWFISGMLLVGGLYAIPVIVWYNNMTTFTWEGVVLQFAAFTCFNASFMIYIRLFGTWK
jgi:hypothetical protein